VLLDRHLLDELEGRWRAQRAPILDHLTPGLGDEQIIAIAAAAGVRLPTEARLWWEWHNGVPSSRGSKQARRAIGGPDYEYIPLEEAAEEYSKLREMARNATAGTDLDPDDFWHPAWWPISSDAKGAWIACECDVAENAPTPIRAIHFADSTQFEPPVLGSFGELIQHLIDAIDRGVWFYDSAAGRWEQRFELQTPEERAARIL
jgi:cell wall assembly regulator SMI1